MINTTPQLYPLEVKVGTRRYLVLGWTNSTPSEPIVVPNDPPSAARGDR